MIQYSGELRTEAPVYVKVKRVFEFRVCTEFVQDSQFKTGCVLAVGIQHAVAASKRIVIEVFFRHIPGYSRSFASFAGETTRLCLKTALPQKLNSCDSLFRNSQCHGGHGNGSFVAN